MGWGSGPRGPTRGPPRGPRPRDRSGYDAGRDDPRDRDRGTDRTPATAHRARGAGGSLYSIFRGLEILFFNPSC